MPLFAANSGRRDEGVGIAGRIVDRFRIGLGMGDQLGDRFRGHRRMHHDEEGVVAEVSDRREILHDVVGRLLAHVGHDGERAVRAEQERVAVGGRAFHLQGRERAVGARLGNDDDGLPERLRQLLAGDAGEGVARRARPERNDEPDRPRRIGLRVDRSLRQEKNRGNQDGSQPLHGETPPLVRLVAHTSAYCG